MSECDFNTRRESMEDAMSFVLEKKAKQLVDSSIVGRWLFLAQKNDDGCEIISCRFYKELDSKEWKFEWFSEANPPENFLCPEKILSLSTSNEPKAVEWRNNCGDQKKQKALQRNLNKEKYQLFSSMKAKESSFEIEGVGRVVFEGFYMQSKTEIVVRLESSSSLRKLRLSLVDIEGVRESLSMSGVTLDG